MLGADRLGEMGQTGCTGILPSLGASRGNLLRQPSNPGYQLTLETQTPQGSCSLVLMGEGGGDSQGLAKVPGLEEQTEESYPAAYF